MYPTCDLSAAPDHYSSLHDFSCWLTLTLTAAPVIILGDFQIQVIDPPTILASWFLDFLSFSDPVLPSEAPFHGHT